MNAPERIRTSENSETWKVPGDSGAVRYVRIDFDADLDAVTVSTADHKDPWVCDGERHDSFSEARRAWGLPDEDAVPDLSELEGATVTASCLCAEIDPSDRPCIVCDALAFLEAQDASR